VTASFCGRAIEGLLLQAATTVQALCQSQLSHFASAIKAEKDWDSHVAD
jgi:hypothetical protein